MYFDTTYCNASLVRQAEDVLQDPYPYRFKCFVSTTQVRIDLSTEFPSVYPHNPLKDYVLKVFVKFFVNLNQPSGYTGYIGCYGTVFNNGNLNGNLGITY